jgi:hypothetical protein
MISRRPIISTGTNEQRGAAETEQPDQELQRSETLITIPGTFRIAFGFDAHLQLFGKR